MAHLLLDLKTITKIADITIAGKRELLAKDKDLDPDDAFNIAFTGALSREPFEISLSLRGRIKSAVGMNLVERRKPRGMQQGAKVAHPLYRFKASYDLTKKSITLIEEGDQITFNYKYDDLGLYFGSVIGSVQISERFQREADITAASALHHIQHNELVRVKTETKDFITLILEGEHEVSFFCTDLVLRFSFFKPKKTETKYVSAMVFKLAWERAEKHFGIGEDIGPLFGAR